MKALTCVLRTTDAFCIHPCISILSARLKGPPFFDFTLSLSCSSAATKFHNFVLEVYILLKMVSIS